MDRKALINILENVFPPSVNQAIKSDMLGKTPFAVAGGANATITLDFGSYPSIHLTTGSVNITALNATVSDLEEGEEIILVITQGATARTLAWGTGFKFAGDVGPIITPVASAVDVFKGVVVGGNIVLSVVAQSTGAAFMNTDTVQTTLTTETTVTLDFSENVSQELTLGSQNITALNGTLTGLPTGTRVLLRLTQDATARTVAWGTGFEFEGGTGPTVTASSSAVDLFEGIVSGGAIVLRVVAQDIS